MTATRTAWTRDRPPERADIDAAFHAEGVAPRTWADGPGVTYGWHAHGFHKALYCVEGAIVFHTREGDVELRAGDRLDLAPGTEHAATVGAAGVTCAEAYLHV